MGKLYERIQQAVADDYYLISRHANQRLRERGIRAWQIVAGLNDGTLLQERTNARPNPAIEIEELLPDGTAVHAVWAWSATDRAAMLITVHYYDR